MSIPSLIRLIPTSSSEQGTVLVLLDHKAVDSQQKQMIEDAFQTLPKEWQNHLVLAEPDITSWILRVEVPMELHVWASQMENALRSVDWTLQTKKIKEVGEMVTFLRAKLPRFPGSI